MWFKSLMIFCFTMMVPAYSLDTKYIRGINWFGFENGQTSPDGLWIGGSSMATDLNTIAYRLKLMGFNSVRLPFTFNYLELAPLPKKTTCKTASLKDIVTSTFDPSLSKKLEGLAPQPNTLDLIPSGNVCNAYLDRSGMSTFDRLIYTMSLFARNGFTIVLDYHPMGKEGYARSPAEFSRKWFELMKRIKASPEYARSLKGKIIMDLMNEPDSMNIGWEAATRLYIPTMDMAYKLFGKDIFYMVEGTGQVRYNLNWGDGFVTRKDIIRQYGIDDASVFFNAVMTKPYLDRVIISPHMYGPSVSKATVAFKGIELEKRLNASFGYLADKGYCKEGGGRCHKFPIVIGEFGSNFVMKEDLEHYEDFQKYMNKYFGKKMSWMYWAYNRNSGDTGGIVKDNWLEWEWGKLRWLNKKMHLRPWYEPS